MTISFSGLASGLDTSGWVEALVSVKQAKVTSLQEELQAIQLKKSSLTATRSSVSSLRTAIEKLTDKKFGGTYDLFGKNAAVIERVEEAHPGKVILKTNFGGSSNEDIFTATATTAAVKQTYNISVQRLATMTKATSLNSASSIADDSTKLSGLGITAGKLTVYVDGLKNTIDIEENDEFGNLKTDLAAIGVNADIGEDGKLTLESALDGQPIHVGATTDTTNFVSITGLASQDDGTYKSSISLYKANSSTVLTFSIFCSLTNSSSNTGKTFFLIS